MNVKVSENEVELELTYGGVSLTLDKRTDTVAFNSNEIDYAVLNKLMKALKKAKNRPQVGGFDED